MKRDVHPARRRILAALAILTVLAVAFGIWATRPVLRISNWETGEVYAQSPISPGDTLYFGWIHSLEKIPWNEYYHVDRDLNLVLDTISFPAFGAGIPEAKGETCYVRDGLIYMSGIGQVFEEFVWLNSHFATREICIGDKFITQGSDLPEHVRLRLVIERRISYGK